MREPRHVVIWTSTQRRSRSENCEDSDARSIERVAAVLTMAYAVGVTVCCVSIWPENVTDVYWWLAVAGAVLWWLFATLALTRCRRVAPWAVLLAAKMTFVIGACKLLEELGADTSRSIVYLLVAMVVAAIVACVYGIVVLCETVTRRTKTTEVLSVYVPMQP
ncbi:MAG: hypothetical protein KGL39_13145 [Patescibacteria group bacterium]|nr:hypothetical protein [Patescibacteria group bacterium]